MTTSTLAAARPTVPPQLGTVTVVAAVVGALSAAVVLVVPPQVAEDRYSYPFSSAGHAAAQLFFAVQHLGRSPG